MNGLYDGCSNDYSQSAVKQIIDGWANKYIGNNLETDSEGYKARLVSNNDLFNLLEFKQAMSNGSFYYTSTMVVEVESIFNSYSTFTMATLEDDTKNVLRISGNRAAETSVGGNDYIRPVITLKKSAIEE